MYIDTHCHLNLPEFRNDLKETIKRAESAQVTHIIVPGIDLETSQLTYNMGRESSIVQAAVGLHPNNIKDANVDNLEAIAELASRPEVVAIGEIGLDYFRNTSLADEQRKTLQYLLSIAIEEAKPVLLHARAASDEMLEILRVYRPDGLRGVWHCFEGNWDLAKQILDIGFFIGLTGNITYSDKEDVKEVITNAPLDQILIETDAPYLPPNPYRGQRNEPAFVVEVARKIAETKNITPEEVGEITSHNAIKLFNL